MESKVSKSKFRAHALEFLREVEQTGMALIVTDHGRPVIRITPYLPRSNTALADLRGSVIRYDSPMVPIEAEDWCSNR